MEMNETNQENYSSGTSETPVKVLRDCKNNTYIDLYLSVSESPYGISRIGRYSEDSFACNETLQVNSDATLNVQNTDCTIFLPTVNCAEVKTSVDEFAIDPLSLTLTDHNSLRHSISDNTFNVKESSEGTENDVNSTSVTLAEHTLTTDMSRIKYGDETIFISENNFTGVRDCPVDADFDPLSITNINKDMEVNIESPSKTVDISVIISSCTIEKTPDSGKPNHISFDKIISKSLSPELDSSDVSLGFELKSILNNDSSGIGSLLMLSTEPNDSLSSSADFFSSKSTIKEYEYPIANHKSSLDLFGFDNNDSKCKSASKKMSFNSMIHESTRLSTNEINSQQNNILSNLPMTNSSLNNVTDHDANASISFSNYDKWLPSMKTQLKELMEYIKFLSAKNEDLEDKMTLLSKDNDDLKNSKDELSAIHEQIESENKLLATDLESLKVENESLKQEIDSLMNNFKSMKGSHELCEFKYKTVEDENTVLKNQADKIKSLKNDYEMLKTDHELCDLKNEEAQNDICDLRNQLSKIKSLKNDYELLRSTYESCQKKYEEALNEIDGLNNQLVNMQQCLGENEQRSKNLSEEFVEKYSMLESDCQNLKDSLRQSEMKLKSLEEDNILMNQLRQDKEYFSDEISELKTRLNELTNENVALTEDKKNREEELKAVSLKLELIQNEFSNLNTEMFENKQMLCELLNVQNNCTYKELVSKFQKQFYDFTLLEEKIDKEKLNSCAIKTENVTLKEENQLLLENVDRLERELKEALEELRNEKDNLSTLKKECFNLQNEYKINVRNVDSIREENITINEKFENFKTELCLCLGISSDSHVSIINKITNLMAEIHTNRKNLNIMQDKIQLFEDCYTFWQTNKNVFTDIIQINCEVESNFNDLSKNMWTSNNSVIESLVEKCLNFKKKLENISLNISPEVQTVLKEMFQDLSGVVNSSISLTENNLSMAKKYAEHNARLSLSGGSLKEEDSSFFKDSVDKIVNSSDSKQSFEADVVTINKNEHEGIVGCMKCCEKLQEMHLLLVDRNGKNESQLLEINNLKSRYYSKSQALENTRKELHNIKLDIMERESEYKETKERLKILQVEKVVTDACTQCEVESPQKQPLPPPPNFVQMCKMKELHRKLEKMNKVILSMKEDSKKKDAKIASLNEELNNLSKQSTLKFNRAILEDRTNANET